MPGFATAALHHPTLANRSQRAEIRHFRPDTYSHVLPGMQEDAVSRLDLLLGAALKKLAE